MKLPAFELERYLAKHEFSAPHLLCASDCESLSLGELLDFEPDARARFEKLWLGYTESPGHPDLRQAISRLYTSISHDQVLVHSGAEEAIFNFMNGMLAPGDHLIVHWPCYQSLSQVAQGIGCEITKWEADPSKGWELDVEFLKKNIKRSTKAVILNSPHNPTGYLMGKEKFAAVVDCLRQAGCILFMDEVYRGLEYDPQNTLPSGCDIFENAVSLGVMSKSFGLAGLRIGWIATKNRRIYEEMEKLKDYTTICNSAPSEFLATLALRHKDRIVNRNLDIIQKNAKLLKAFFACHDRQLSWVCPKAGCIAFPKWEGASADAVGERLLAEAGVLLAPGSRFGFADPYFRIGFGRSSFPAGLEKLDRFLLG